MGDLRGFVTSCCDCLDWRPVCQDTVASHRAPRHSQHILGLDLPDLGPTRSQQPIPQVPTDSSLVEQTVTEDNGVRVMMNANRGEDPTLGGQLMHRLNERPITRYLKERVHLCHDKQRHNTMRTTAATPSKTRKHFAHGVVFQQRGFRTQRTSTKSACFPAGGF